MCSFYNVVLKTKNVDGAGTNADVAIELRGQNGGSGWIILDHPHPYDDRERGSMDTYGLSLNFWIGDVTEVAFRLRDADRDRPDWLLEYVEIIDFYVSGNQAWQFDYDQWIAIDGKTSWFDGPVLNKRRYLGSAPNAVYAGGGASSMNGYGTSSHALTSGFKTDGCMSLSAVSRSNDKLDIFCSENSGNIFTAAWEPDRDGWRGWWKIGAINVQERGVTSVVSRSLDKLDVFCAAKDGQIYTAAWEPAFSDSWHGWWKIGNLESICGVPIGGVSRNQDKLDIFCIGRDGYVYTAAWEPAFSDGWHGWWKIGNLEVIPSIPVNAASRSQDKLDVFSVGRDGFVYTAAWEPNRGGWRGWWKVGGLRVAPTSSVTAVSRSKDKLDIFCVGADGNVYTAAWEPAFADGWHGWWKIGNLEVVPGIPVNAVSRSQDKLDVFSVGKDGFIYTAAWEPNRGGWRGWWKVGDLRVAPTSSVAAVSRSKDKLDIFCVGADGNVYTAAWEPAFADGWHGWWKIQEFQAIFINK